MEHSPGAGQAAAPGRPASTARDLHLLEEMAATIHDAAAILSATLAGTRPVDSGWQAIRDLEHKGDAVARDIFEMLVRSEPVSLAPESLRVLTGYLDDVLDAIEAAAARLAIHRVRRALPQARELGEVVLASARELGRAVRLGDLQDVFPHTRMLHRLEIQGDDLLRGGIEALFRGRRAPKEIIKWKDILEILEASTDRCEDVANVLETLVIQAGGEERLASGAVVMRVERHEVTVGGRPVALSAKEFDLLHLLLRHQGKVVRRERLIHEVWGADYFGDTRTLDTHIGWLRKKLESTGGIRIVTVRGLGYRLDTRE